jgi:hypothetical protein
MLKRLALLSKKTRFNRSFFVFGWALLSVASISSAFAAEEDPLFITQSIAIARKLIVNPAMDLVDENGRIIDADDVLARKDDGTDVSLFNPAPTDVWGGTLKARDLSYPAEAADGYINMRFDSLVTSPRGLARSRIVTDDAAATPYRLVMSWNMHSALMNAELLSQLGYTVDLPRRYAKARLKFPDVATRDLFLTELSGGTGTIEDQWLIKKPAADDLVIELRDFALEPARIATPTYYWGAISAKEMQNRRVIRALLVPLVLTSIPESINLWTWEAGKLVNERVLLYHPFAGNFQGQLNFDDARWIARKMCSIPEAGLHKIVAAGGYPTSIEPLLFEKLKSRRNNLMNLFQVDCRDLPVNASLSFNDPETGEALVKNGKLLRKEFPGYGFSFIGNDPDSPLRKDELFRYMKLRGLGVVLNAGLAELNSKLLKFDQSDANQYKDQHWAFKNGPREKLNLSATRKLVSGTYYGSESQVQLLDQVSISATLGYFVGMKNRAIQQVDFSLAPNVAVSRSYGHVKPMASIQEAVKTPWKDLPVVPKMRELAKLLDAKTELEQDAATSAFLEKFLVGENFSITDSLDTNATLGATMPLPPFAAIPNLGKLSFSAGFDHLILRRTMIQRQADGTLQITLQHVKNNITSFSLTYNFLVDVAAAAAALKGADSDATVFVIDPDLLTNKKQLNESLRDLLMNNDSSTLEKDFKAYQLGHNLKSQTGTFKLLPWTFAKYHEEHLLDAFAPGAVQDDAHKRELYSIRDRRLSGSDWLSFFSGAASAASKEYLLPDLDIDLTESDGRIDPAGSFLGRSHFHEIQLESELTPARNAKTLMTVQETYMGWTLTKARMLRILKRLEKKAHEITHDSPSLIHVEEFLSTTKLLLYQITSSLRVSGPGLDFLVDVAKASPNSNRFLGSLFGYGRIENADPEYNSWVADLYDLLRKVPAPGKTHLENRERIRKLYAVSKYLSGKIEPKDIIKLVGTENAIFQISVTGFRKNDENGDSAYLSASIGETNELVNDGAFGSFVREQNISTYEVRGTYLGNGL